jgi:outer membrane protein OmpA-like peptidoglycan-associated protein
MESKFIVKFFVLLLCAMFVVGCAPISEDANPRTGSDIAAVAGGAAGAGISAALHAPPAAIVPAGIMGASLGYYLSTLRFAAGGIIKLHGKVYALGDYIIIEIPSDNLFDANTADFLDGTEPALNGLVDVLRRVPHHNIIISGNTSGFGSEKDENRLSQHRAERVASWLWSHGISNISSGSTRRLIYVGYGDNYPIASDLHILSLRANSRIQIIAYPSYEKLHWDKLKKSKNYKVFDNIGKPLEQDSTIPGPNENYSNAFSDDHLPESKAYAPSTKEEIVAPSVPLENTGLSSNMKNEFDDAPYVPTRVDIQDDSAPDPMETFSNPPATDTNTMVDRSVKKHWGFKGDNELKDETPAAQLPAPDTDPSLAPK